jgi:hypothetical protein
MVTTAALLALCLATPPSTAPAKPPAVDAATALAEELKTELLPDSVAGPNVHGLRWVVAARRYHAAGAPIREVAKLLPDRDHVGRRFTRERDALVVTLRGPGGQLRARKLPPETERFEAVTAAGDALSLAFVDLTDWFGPLEPGRHVVSVTIRGGGYSLEGYSDAPAVSVEWPIEVVHVTAADVAKVDRPSKDVTIEVTQDVGDYCLGRLTNHTRRAIGFQAYVSPDDKNDEPISVRSDADAYDPRPGGGWRTVLVSWCGTGAGWSTLEPGQSVRVVLPKGPARQWYRFTLGYKFVDGDGGGGAVSAAQFDEPKAAR